MRIFDPKAVLLLIGFAKSAAGFQTRTQMSKSRCLRHHPSECPGQELLPPWSAPGRAKSWLATSLTKNSDLLEEFEPNGVAEDSTTKTRPLEQGGYSERFGSIGRLYSNGAKQQITEQLVLERLYQATVVVVGIGGVGSWAAEALCRSGIGNLVLVDLDDICLSNTNRQLHATTSVIGQMKIDVMKQRLVDIHPGCNVTLIHDFVSEDNAHEMLQSIGSITALIDAIDGATQKSALLGACTDLAIPVVTCGGAAGRKDMFQIVSGDLVNVEDDRLLASCRRILRKKHRFPAGQPASQRRQAKKKMKEWRISCVYTQEPPPPKPSAGENTSSFRLCDGSLGTACFVTGAYGFAAASICIDMIAYDKFLPPRRG